MGAKLFYHKNLQFFSLFSHTIQKCDTHPNMFSLTITKNHIKTFSYAQVKFKNPIKNQKIIETYQITLIIALLFFVENANVAQPKFA